MSSLRILQLALVPDVTGSMAAANGEVRAKNCALVDELHEAFPGIEIAVIAVGDDPPPGYMTRHLPFTSDRQAVKRFLTQVPNAGGGDTDECYEKALNIARSLNWRDDAKKVLVAIGDAYPHPINHPKNPTRLDWRVEARELASIGVTIYSVQCLALFADIQAKRFWAELA